MTHTGVTDDRQVLTQGLIQADIDCTIPLTFEKTNRFQTTAHSPQKGVLYVYGCNLQAN